MDKYEFNWCGKSKSIELANIPSTGTLKPDKEGSKNWDDTENIYIEGDNLEVLKLLQKSYFGKVKMIYIDPPYNTGNDFVYKDNFKDSIPNYKEITNQTTRANPETNGRYHTDWLNMMYPRLKLARNLMTDDGIIFMSIDENEVYNLKKVCDEIFGESNNLLSISVNRTSEIATATTIMKHEYIISYAKNKQAFNQRNVEYSKFVISRGTVGNINQSMPVITFPAGIPCYNLKDGIYKKTRKIEGSKENIENLDEIIIENGKLKKNIKLKARWRSSNDMRNFFNNQCRPTKAKISGDIVEIYFDNDKFNPQIKKATNNKLSSLFLENKKGSIELENLGLNCFPYPKSTKLIKVLMEQINLEKDCLILDLFSGSATTSHSVIQFNAEDGGNRKFIMVQFPEQTDEKSEAYKAGYKNICEIGKERIRRAGDKIVSENKDKEGIENLDIGFKVFKLDSCDNMSEEDLIYKAMLENGIELIIKDIEKLNICNNKVYNINQGELLICFTNDLNKYFLQELEKYKNKNTRVLFF